MSQYGFFLTQEDKSVLEPRKPNEYIVNSNYKTFKIYDTINTSIAVPSGTSGATVIAHPLGYPGAYLAYYRLKPTTSVWWADMTRINENIADNDGYGVVSTQINNSEIRFSAQDFNSQGDRTIEVKSFMMVDPIDLISSNVTGLSMNEGIGFKASKPDIDVLSARPHQLTTSSKYDSLKFHDDRQISVTLGADVIAGTNSFEHGLSYVPMFWPQIVQPSNETYQNFAGFPRVPLPRAIGVKANRSTITVCAVQITGIGAFTFKFRIVVFKNKLSDA